MSSFLFPRAGQASRWSLLRALSVVALFAAMPGAQVADKELPREWVDPDTGHRVVRLSDEPGTQSLYFHQNGYTPDGTKLVVTTPSGLSTIDLKSRVVEKVVDGRVNLIMTGRKTGRAYYARAGVVYAVDLQTQGEHCGREVTGRAARSRR